MIHFLKRCVAHQAPRTALVHGSRKADEVAVTFDDGPHPEQTPRLLEQLARKNVHATFFLQGDHAAQWPHLVRDIHAAGHQVANHGFLHRFVWERPVDEFIADVESAQKVLEDAVGKALQRDFRPPYGKVTPRAFLRLVEKGYRSIFWTVDSEDTQFKDPQTLLEHVNGLSIGRGDVVLFHEDYPHTVTAIPQIVDRLRAQGLAPRRIDQLTRR